MILSRPTARRALLASALAFAAVGGAALPAAAQAPLQLKIIAPAAPGGGWDSAARSLQQVMTATGLARRVQVLNVPGAGGTVGLAQFVDTARGDGNQLLVTGLTMVGAALLNKVPAAMDAVTPIARLTGDPVVVVVPAHSPYKTIKDLAAVLKADTAKVTWAGGSAGGADHILVGLLTQQAGGDAARLNYHPFSGGGEALTELLAGRATAGVSGYSEFQAQIKAGKLRALAVSSGKRINGVDVPTLKEQGLDVELVNWRGVVAGPGISATQKAVLSATMAKTLQSPEWARLAKARGWDDAYLDAGAYAAFLDREQQRVKDVLGSIGLLR